MKLTNINKKYQPSLAEEKINEITAYLSNPDLQPISPLLAEIVNEITAEITTKYNHKFILLLEQQKAEAFNKGLAEGKRQNFTK